MITAVFYVVGSMIGIVAIMAGVGLLLRPAHLAARTAVIPRPPTDLFETIRDVERHPTWRKDIKRVELLPPVDGKRSFREHGRQGKIPFVIDEEIAPAGGGAGRLVTRIADDGLPFGGRWIIVVAPHPGGSRVTVTEDGFVKNPIFRFLSRTVFSLTATQERWLRALAAHAGATATPEPAEPII